MSIYSGFFRKTVLPLILKREQRGSALTHWRFLEKSQFWSKQKLLDYQWLQLKKLLNHCYETTGHYKRIFDERGLSPSSFKSFEDLSLLPILTRGDLFNHRNELISRKFNIQNMPEVLTGGTTGQQAVLYRNQESFNIKLGLTWRHEGWIGRKPCDKMAYIWPAHADFHGEETWKSHLKNRFLLGDVVYYAGYLSEEIYMGFYNDIIKFRPEYMKVFPSALENFTQFMLAHNLKPPHLKGIMSTGEVLYDNHRKLFEEIYSCPVFNMYGSRETGNTSCECSTHEGLHIAMETSFVEFISNGRNVSFGEEGEILITDLTNYAFPLIRYQINDFGISLRQSCSCGRELPLMSPGVGRLLDSFYTADGRKQSGLMLGVHISTDQRVRIGQMQITQKTLTDFQVKITNRPEPTAETFDFIKARMKKMIGENININIEVVNEIPKEKSGKTRFVICEVTPPESTRH
jgi:phenylacetate-CoA ligase